MVAAATNPGEIAIRQGAMDKMFPTTLPCGQGSDFAGRVVEVGSDVTDLAVDDEVIGFSMARSSQADFVVVPADQLTPKPAELGWADAGSLYVVGATAYAAVRAVSPQTGEVVAISNAGGGVGSVAVQLANRAGARVLGIAGADNADFLTSLGAEPIEYGDGLADRLRAASPDGIDAFIDTRGGGYLDLAIELGVAPERIDTIIDFEGAERLGAKAEGSSEAGTAAVLGELAGSAGRGELLIRVGRTYPLEQVREAYTALEDESVRGKIVLLLR